MTDTSNFSDVCSFEKLFADIGPEYLGRHTLDPWHLDQCFAGVAADSPLPAGPHRVPATRRLEHYRSARTHSFVRMIPTPFRLRLSLSSLWYKAHLSQRKCGTTPPPELSFASSCGSYTVTPPFPNFPNVVGNQAQQYEALRFLKTSARRLALYQRLTTVESHLSEFVRATDDGGEGGTLGALAPRQPHPVLTVGCCWGICTVWCALPPAASAGVRVRARNCRASLLAAPTGSGCRAPTVSARC